MIPMDIIAGAHGTVCPFEVKPGIYCAFGATKRDIITDLPILGVIGAAP
jgi:hypothetical protein